MVVLVVLEVPGPEIRILPEISSPKPPRDLAKLVVWVVLVLVLVVLVVVLVVLAALVVLVVLEVPGPEIRILRKNSSPEPAGNRRKT